MATIEDLYNCFSSFCQFGSSRNLSSMGSMTDLAGPTMDGARWAKFCRDSGLLDKDISATDIDIMFNKVKAKTARRIDFDQFQAALRLIAAKRFGNSKSPTEAFAAIIRTIVNGNVRPVLQGTVRRSAGCGTARVLTDGCLIVAGSWLLADRGCWLVARGCWMAQAASNDAVTQRMTDHTLYTGTHKNRFDASGNGLGMSGRDQPSRTNDLAKITNREESNVRGVPLSAAYGSNSNMADGRYSTSSITPSIHNSSNSSHVGNGTSSGKRGHQSVVTASSERLDLQSSKPKKVGSPVKRSTSNLANIKPSEPTPLSSLNKRSTSGSMGSSVFERLTDTKAYTGTHKHRFNDDGSGRGIDGRDPNAGTSGTKTLASILRT
ncbi:p25-alpha-domain-containing protein [Entophlyctis helioformis]|nr:p25-alpha-domain-containing protein [Entophlyctis helioformis]KAI8924054.1 p25-alpha-domain-containing protein [Entophlyctis helioformis]